MERVTTRIPEEDAETLAEFEAETGLDRETALRRLIRDGLADWRTERAVEKLRDHSVTVREAANLADASYVEMLQIAADEGIDVGYESSDLERDVENI